MLRLPDGVVDRDVALEGDAHRHEDGGAHRHELDRGEAIQNAVKDSSDFNPIENSKTVITRSGPNRPAAAIGGVFACIRQIREEKDKFLGMFS